MAVSEVILIHIYSSLRDCREGEAIKKAKELAAYYGVALQTIYRWAAKKGLRWRKEKITRGQSRVTDDVLMKAATLMYCSRRKSNEIPLPACDAKEILEDSGFDTGVSTSWFLAKLREKNISAKDLLRPTPHVSLLSDHPNHVWQFDVTNCLQYFLDVKTGMGERDPDMELYKNKIVKTAKAIKRQLLRYAVVDHCTGAFYFRYFYASGEKAADGAQFLFEAMRGKDELIEHYWNGESKTKTGKYRFHGVPLMLVADRGSIMIAKANQSLFDSLRVKVETHLPGNPRAKGAIEGLMKILNRFEAKLRFKRPACLADVNKWALDYCIKFNAVNEMRGLAPRSALWSRITQEQLRLCPDEKLYRMLIREPEKTSKVSGAQIIRIDNRSYKIPDPNAANKWVTVVRNAYEYPSIDVHFNGYVWLLEPLAKDEYGRLTTGVPYGEYKSPKYTDTQKAKKEMEKVAEEWGLTWKGAGQKRIAIAPKADTPSELQIFDHQADKVENVVFMDKRGTALDVKQPPSPENEPLTTSAMEISRSITVRKISFTKFLMMLKEEIGVIPKELNKTLRAKYGTSIEINEAEGVIEEQLRIKEGGLKIVPDGTGRREVRA